MDFDSQSLFYISSLLIFDLMLPEHCLLTQTPLLISSHPSSLPHQNQPSFYEKVLPPCVLRTLLQTTLHCCLTSYQQDQDPFPWGTFKPPHVLCYFCNYPKGYQPEKQESPTIWPHLLLSPSVLLTGPITGLALKSKQGTYLPGWRNFWITPWENRLQVSS